MPRTYSQSFLVDLYQADPDRAGTALALACVKANLPTKYIAVALDVTRMTVFSWFRGKPLRHKNMLKVEMLTNKILGDMKLGVLPAKNVPAAKTYIEEMIGRKI